MNQLAVVSAKLFADTCNNKYYALWFDFQTHEKMVCIHVRFMILQLRYCKYTLMALDTI